MILRLTTLCCQAQDKQKSQATFRNVQGQIVETSELDAFIPKRMEEARVPGMQIVVVKASRIVYSRAFGFKDRSTGERLNPNTDFYAASLSKTVFAYLVMRLVEEHTLDLDKPLYTYLSKPLEEFDFYKDMRGDDRYKRITARLVLSHQTGWPNFRWLNPDRKLDFKYAPGARFSYSGEGMNYLQFVIEQITGKGLDELSREKVFKPLGMTRTRYVWDSAFESDYALGHDEAEKPLPKQKRTKAGAAGSMETTAEDYARLLIAIADAKGLRRASIQEMLRPQVAIHSKKMFGPLARETTDENEAIRLGWGLGWGVFTTPYGPVFFHGGHDDGWNHYTLTYRDKGISVVILTNSSNGETMFQALLNRTIGDKYSPADWFNWTR